MHAWWRTADFGFVKKVQDDLATVCEAHDQVLYIYMTIIIVEHDIVCVTILNCLCQHIQKYKQASFCW
jgi:hypothetical protein